MSSTSTVKHALSFKILAECSTSKARASIMCLPHASVETPVFMPVGTQGTLKGLVPDQLRDLNCKIMLGNTYHLGHRPGPELLEKAGGLHKFMNWDRALLTSITRYNKNIGSVFRDQDSGLVSEDHLARGTSGTKGHGEEDQDSGGFQMVSLLKLAEITEEGVKFQSPHDGSEMLLTPEKSIEIQNSIGADIIMQLDDVVHSSVSGPRLEEAMYRTIRWLDRCLEAHKRPSDQCLFPIVQGGLNAELRRKCAHELIKRNVGGYAIGGLSGGEEKSDFWRMVTLSTDVLPKEKPRYLMGVGFAVDLVVCVALGCDMFDCVFPTRTARFGCALVKTGQLNLKSKVFAQDFQPIDKDCGCDTCRAYTRAYLHTLANNEAAACCAITVHNVAYQLSLMTSMRQSILEDRFPAFVQNFFSDMFPKGDYPEWAVDCLSSVGIDLVKVS